MGLGVFGVKTSLGPQPTNNGYTKKSYVFRSCFIFQLGYVSEKGTLGQAWGFGTDKPIWASTGNSAQPCNWQFAFWNELPKLCIEEKNKLEKTGCCCAGPQSPLEPGPRCQRLLWTASLSPRVARWLLRSARQLPQSARWSARPTPAGAGAGDGHACGRPHPSLWLGRGNTKGTTGKTVALHAVNGGISH